MSNKISVTQPPKIDILSHSFNTRLTRQLHVHVPCAVGSVGGVQAVGRRSWSKSCSLFNFLYHVEEADAAHHGDEADDRPMLGVPTK